MVFPLGKADRPPSGALTREDEPGDIDPYDHMCLPRPQGRSNPGGWLSSLVPGDELIGDVVEVVADNMRLRAYA
jgi:hypothetical protein